MLTLHAYPKAMKAAVAAARGSDLCLLGVTVLTSMDEQDLIDAGYEYDPHTLVLRRAEQALQAGMGGIVCAASEAAAVRKIVGPELAVVTPGIRPAGGDPGDQKRVMTPGDAIRAGASHLVVARPIVGATDRAAAAQAILAEMRERRRSRLMAKGYWIAHVEVRDPEGYKGYVAASKIAFDKYGAKMLARGGAYEQTEGASSLTQRRHRVPVAQGGTGLLPFAGIPGGEGDPAEICRGRDGAGRRRRKLTAGTLLPADYRCAELSKPAMPEARPSLPGRRSALRTQPSPQSRVRGRPVSHCNTARPVSRLSPT